MPVGARWRFSCETVFLFPQILMIAAVHGMRSSAANIRR
jgi:hypothetical protein